MASACRRPARAPRRGGSLNEPFRAPDAHRTVILLLSQHYGGAHKKGSPSMPTVRPRWSIEGTQWSAPQNTEREPRELLSNEER